jgi:hypothetical protein
MHQRSSYEVQQFRYSVWQGGQIDLPEVVPWHGELDWPWFRLDPLERDQPRIAAPADLHVFEFGDVELTRESLEIFCRSVGLPAGRSDRAWGDVPAGRSERVGRDWYADLITMIASGLHLDVPDFTVEHPNAWHAAELIYRIELVRRYVSTLHALNEGRPIAQIWNVEHARSRPPELVAWGMFEYLLNAGLAQFHIRVSSPEPALVERDPPSAYEVACLAVANDLAARAPYRVCANETCRRVFTRQRGRAEHQQFRTQGVIYCTPQCSRAQSQRDRRRKARQRPEKHDG